MGEAWEAGFNQEGPSLLGDAKVRLLILPEVHARLRARRGISHAFRGLSDPARAVGLRA